MSANSKKTTTKGKRYTDAEKQEVISFVGKVNAEKGRGGQAAAAKKYNISVLTVATWLKSAAPLKPVKDAVKPAKAVKVAVKPAKAVKVAVKPAKAVKAAVKPAKKKGKKGSLQGKRYTDAEKKDVVDFVVAVNTSKGRGGLSAATQKFGISPLSISSWLKKSGVKAAKPLVSVKPAKPAKAAKVLPAKSGLSATAIVALGSQIAKAEAELAKLKVMIRTLK